MSFVPVLAASVQWKLCFI